MNTLERLENELKEAKLKVKVAQAANVLVKAFLNRNFYKFQDFRGQERFLFQTTSLTKYYYQRACI